VQRFLIKLDLQLFAQEKTEPATPKKKQDARKKGQVAKSSELPGAFILFFMFLFIAMFGGFIKEKIFVLFQDHLVNKLNTEVTVYNVENLFLSLLQQGLVILAPFFAIAILIAFLGNFVQFGLLFSADPLKMKFNKINPIQGFKRIFSLRSVIEFFKSILKMLIIGLLVYFTLWGEKEKILSIAKVPLEQAFSFVASLTISLGLQIGGLLIVMAVLDFLYQRYEHLKGLKMSKQDIKDEYKKSEGDPLIKAKIKEKQRRMAMMRMMQDVPKADVVITNPTHYAVALKYDSSVMDAPKIVAKGTDFVALKIKEKAKEHGVAVMENKPLARALYAQAEIGDTIPADLFQAVAEVLAYVFKSRGVRNMK